LNVNVLCGIAPGLYHYINLCDLNSQTVPRTAANGKMWVELILIKKSFHLTHSFMLVLTRLFKVWEATSHRRSNDWHTSLIN